MKQYKVDYEMIIGEGMFHCYPLFPICREGKEGWEMMVRLIKNIRNERKGIDKIRLPKEKGISIILLFIS
jgi:hypothetical protein